jgi:hypothetical protein
MELLLFLVILLLLAFNLFQYYDRKDLMEVLKLNQEERSLQEKAHQVERAELLDRLMSKSIGEFKSHKEGKPQQPKVTNFIQHEMEKRNRYEQE